MPSKFFIKSLGLLIVLFLIAPFSFPEKIKARDLPEKYRTWLEEEVPYIITSVERDVFFELKADRERDVFIQAFWKQRDPTKGTDKNEFREEHYRRIQYANRMFIGAGKPGWKTDRGKTYIILGPPMNIRPFDGNDAYYPAVLWSYQGIEGSGLPQAFNLLFYQKGRLGEYILYNPGVEGPWHLLSNFRGNPGDFDNSLASSKISSPSWPKLRFRLFPAKPTSPPWPPRSFSATSPFPPKNAFGTLTRENSSFTRTSSK